MEKINNNNKKVIFDPVYYTDVVEQTEIKNGFNCG